MTKLAGKAHRPGLYQSAGLPRTIHGHSQDGFRALENSALDDRIPDGRYSDLASIDNVIAEMLANLMQSDFGVAVAMFHAIKARTVGIDE